jgi:hypothetical protein
VTNITDANATVSWVTTKPTTGEVEWGTTPGLGNLASSTSLNTTHNVTIGTLSDCDRIYFRVVATDAFGNTSAADAGDGPFEFNAATLPGTIYRDDFDTDTGWTLEGEWEIAAPQGLGSSPGDPVVAYTGIRLLGHDLTGLGANLGDYEAETTESATSPVIDASALTNAELRFQRWLNAANGSIAYLEVKDGTGTWQTLWSSPSFGGFQETAWNSKEFSVSQYADGNPTFQVRFKQVSHIAGSHDAGWNVDQVVLRDGSQPAVGVCGGCVGTPSFAGVATATDDDPCADSGITLTWLRAPAWGSGSTGTYAVYRDTQPGFAPGPSNLVASGVVPANWTDPSPPADVTLYYVVRAENDETCGDGPDNGGATDANLVYGVVRNDTSQPGAGDVGSTLQVDGVNLAHTKLTWSGIADAAAYRVYRSSMPDGGYALEVETAETIHEDPGAYADGQSWFYLIRAADACGNEGP